MNAIRAILAALGWVLVLPIKAYQRVISPLTPPSCRYHPSCSSYAIDAIKVHGPFKGPVLSTWRLLRCNPWTKGGLDPVPERGHWLPDVLPDGKPRSATMVPPDSDLSHGTCEGSDD